MKLLETIRCEGQKADHLAYHQARMNESMACLFGSYTPHTLSTLLEAMPDGVWRARVLYDAHQAHVEYIPYLPRTFARLGVVEANLAYTHKFAHREPLDRLKNSFEGVDDIIIVRQGLITDTTIANIACHIDGAWLTPAQPLLAGTTRARLLDEGLLKCAPLTLSMLQNADSIALMNAMIGFHILPNPTILR